MSANKLLGAKPTTEDLILEWLVITGKRYVRSHQVQLDCVNWMADRSIYRNPATVDRKWRKLREGCLQVRKLEPAGQEDMYEIISCNGIPWLDVIEEASC